MRLHIKSLVSLLHLWFKIKINLFNIVAAVQLGKKKFVPVLIYGEKLASKLIWIYQKRNGLIIKHHKSIYNRFLFHGPDHLHIGNTHNPGTIFKALSHSKEL